MQQRVANPLETLYITRLKRGGCTKSNSYDDLLQATHNAPNILNEL